MIKSMTGYGKGETIRDGYQVIVEIKTVNHRYSNIYLHMPGHLLALESTLHKMLKEKIERGRIDLYLKIEEEPTEGSYEPQVNLTLAQGYLKQLQLLQENLQLQQQISLNDLIALPEVLTLNEKRQDEETLQEIIIETVEKSLQALVQMRTREGEELYNDLVTHLNQIEVELDKIQERAPQVLIEFKQRMKERLEELLQDKSIDEDRLAVEVAILAERCCINEEVVRLKSHIGQFRSTLTKKEAVGRKLDFIAQEMYRETNTIGSKANDAVIANHVVNIKSDIDKIREQIQNIE